MGGRVSDLVASARKSAAGPLLEHLRFVESLPMLELDEVEDLLAALDLDADEHWLADVLARVTPHAYWTEYDGDGDDFDRHFIEERVRLTLGDQWVRLLADALETTRSPAKVMFALRSSMLEHEELVIRLLDRDGGAGWRCITARCTHADPEVRGNAARIAAIGRRLSPPVVDAMLEAVYRATRDATHSYDDQVDGEQVLGEVARAGTALAALAGDLEIILRAEPPVFQARLALALGALGDASSREALAARERAIDDEAEGSVIGSTRAMLRLAQWQLGADDGVFDAALDDAGDNAIFTHPLAMALEAMPVDERLLAALERASRREEWTKLVYGILAKIGPAAASTVGRLTSGEPPDDPDDACAFHRARWSAKLSDDASFAAALEPLLGNFSDCWSSYVALALDTNGWRATVTRGIREQQPATIRALVEHPGLREHLLPELLAEKRDRWIYQLWSRLPGEVFWSSVAVAEAAR